MIRCALESLALKYRRCSAGLESSSAAGSRRSTSSAAARRTAQLCQATADACNRRVVAGPVEATAIGNVMMQAISAGAVADIAQAREVVRASFAVEEYAPRDPAKWDEAYGRFVKLLPTAK